MFPCFCHLSDTHVRCRWNFIDKTLLRSFTSYEILDPSDPFPAPARTPWGWTPRRAYKLPWLGLCRVPRRIERAVYNEQPFGRQSWASDCISQNGPSCPKPCLCCSDSTLFISPETEFQWGALRYVFPKVASGSRIGYVNGPAAGYTCGFC